MVYRLQRQKSAVARRRPDAALLAPPHHLPLRPPPPNHSALSHCQPLHCRASESNCAVRDVCRQLHRGGVCGPDAGALCRPGPYSYRLICRSSLSAVRADHVMLSADHGFQLHRSCQERLLQRDPLPPRHPKLHGAVWMPERARPERPQRTTGHGRPASQQQLHRDRHGRGDHAAREPWQGRDSRRAHRQDQQRARRAARPLSGPAALTLRPVAEARASFLAFPQAR